MDPWISKGKGKRNPFGDKWEQIEPNRATWEQMGTGVFGWRPPAQFRFYCFTVFRLGDVKWTTTVFYRTVWERESIICVVVNVIIFIIWRAFREQRFTAGELARHYNCWIIWHPLEERFFRFFGKGGAGGRQIEPNQPNRTGSIQKGRVPAALSWVLIRMVS